MSKQTEVNCEGWNMQFSDRIKLPDLSQYSFNILELHTQNVSFLAVFFSFKYFFCKILHVYTDQSEKYM